MALRGQLFVPDWINFNNTDGPHSAFEYRTPVEAYWSAKNEK